MSPLTNEQFESEAGAIVLESAILKYLSTANTDERDRFALHIEKNEKSPTLIDDLVAAFPRFGKILRAELQSVKADASSLTTEDGK